MPSLPRYDSQRQLTTQPLAPQATGAGESYKLAQQGLQMAQNFAQAWDDARTTAQLNAFKAQKGIFTRELVQNAQLDPNANNYEKYYDQLKKWKAGALEGMGERAKREASLEMQTTFETTRIQLSGIFQQKAVVEAQKDLGVALDDYKHKALHPSSREDQVQALSDAKNLIERNVADKIISPQEGKRRWEQWQEDLRQSEIDNAIYMNPEQFLKNKGEYEFKDAAERKNAIARANKAIENIKKQQNIARKQRQDEGHITLAELFSKGKLDPETINAYLWHDLVTPDIASLFKDALLSKVSPLADKAKIAAPEAILDLLDATLEAEGDPSSVIEIATKAKMRGDLDLNQYAWFVHQAHEKMNKNESWFQKLGRARKDLNAWVERVMPSWTAPAQASKIMRFIDKIRDGQEPQDAATDIKKETLVDTIGTIPPKEGQIMEDAAGNRAIVYPDGRVEEIR